MQNMGRGGIVRSTRREFLRDVVLGAAVVGAGASFSRGVAAQAQTPGRPFRFIQLSDTHIGYEGDANRNVPGTLERALDRASRLIPRPELLVVTGDLTQATGVDSTRIARLKRFREMVDTLHLPVYTVPGEHDALMDRGRAYQQVMGPLHYRFEHQGVQFFALDNVSHGFFVGEAQRGWLAKELHSANPDAPTVILIHAPLYDAFLPWNWYTYDAAAVLGLFRGFRQVTVLFGHVHQELSRAGRQLGQWAGLPTSWPLPEPDVLTRLEKWPQSESDPYMGLGLKVIDVQASGVLLMANQLLDAPRSPEGTS